MNYKKNFSELSSWFDNYEKNLTIIKKDIEWLLANRNNKIVLAIDFFDLLHYSFPFMAIKEYIDNEEKHRKRGLSKYKFHDRISLIDNNRDFNFNKFIRIFLRNDISRKFIFNQATSDIILLPPYLDEFNDIKYIFKEIREKKNKYFNVFDFKSIINFTFNPEFIISNFPDIYLQILKESDTVEKTLHSLFQDTGIKHIDLVLKKDKSKYDNIIRKVNNLRANEYIEKFNDIRPNMNKIVSNIRDANALKMVEILNSEFQHIRFLLVSGSNVFKEFNKIHPNDYIRELNLFTTYIMLTSDIKTTEGDKFTNNTKIKKKADHLLKFIKSWKETFVILKDVENFCQRTESPLDYDDTFCEEKCVKHGICKSLLREKIPNLNKMKDGIENVNYILNEFTLKTPVGGLAVCFCTSSFNKA